MTPKNSMTTPKGTVLPVMDLKGKPYLTVPYRVLWMREEHPGWSVSTSFLLLEDGRAVARAEVRDGDLLLATAHKEETRAGFPDYLEKAETGAIGRALALCGYGTQFDPGLEEGGRIVDSPVQAPAAARAIPERPADDMQGTLEIGVKKVVDGESKNTGLPYRLVVTTDEDKYFDPDGLVREGGQYAVTLHGKNIATATSL